MSMPFASQTVLEHDLTKNPTMVTWEATRACSLHCLNCATDGQSRRAPAELTTSEARRLIDQIAEFDQPTFEITGGDPLERPDIFELIEYAVERKLHVRLALSSSPKLTIEAIERIRAVGVTTVSISLDSSTPDIHDRIRGLTGNFIKTMDLLRIMRSQDLQIQINTLVSRRTVGCLHETERLVAKVGASVWAAYFLVPTGRAKQEDLLTPREHEHVLKWLVKREREVPFLITTDQAQQMQRIRVQRILGTDAHELTAVRNQLIQLSTNEIDGKDSVFISHTGKVYPSAFMPVAVGDIRYESLATIYRDSPTLQALRRPDGFRGKCGMCEFHNLCGGSRSRAYATTGDYLESDPSCGYQPLTRTLSRGYKSTR